MGAYCYCGRYEHGNVYGRIICGNCVQALLGYTVVVKKGLDDSENTPQEDVRAVLRGKRGEGEGRVSTKTIQKCTCGCVFWRDGGACPMCGEG